MVSVVRYRTRMSEGITGRAHLTQRELCERLCPKRENGGEYCVESMGRCSMAQRARAVGLKGEFEVGAMGMARVLIMTRVVRETRGVREEHTRQITRSLAARHSPVAVGRGASPVLCIAG